MNGTCFKLFIDNQLFASCFRVGNYRFKFPARPSDDCCTFNNVLCGMILFTTHASFEKSPPFKRAFRMLHRLVLQVSQVYQTIEFSRLAALAPFASQFHIERIVVNAAKNLDLQVRIDHRNRMLSFGTDLGVAQKEDCPEVGEHLHRI